jgi:hypothetical protein
LEKDSLKPRCGICGLPLEDQMMIRSSWKEAGGRGFLPPLVHPECDAEEMKNPNHNDIWIPKKLLS